MGTSRIFLTGICSFFFWIIHLAQYTGLFVLFFPAVLPLYAMITYLGELVKNKLSSMQVYSENQQHFRIRPRETQVVEGHSVLLHCHVGSRAGRVQWSKDGFLLGFDPSIPGYPRYTMSVDEKRSIYNLNIRNAQLEDEGEFQCQVGPAPGNIPIRSKAQVTVLVPPRELEIRHLGEGRVVEVKEAERVALTCSAHDGKPAAQLKWYRNGAEVDPSTYMTEVKHSGKFHRTAVSTITLYPKLDDNGAGFVCEASHAALQKPIRTAVTINVLYPPSQPVIEGYHDGDVVQAGDTLTLACISMGGNPPARLVWYKNDAEVDVTYSTSGREATNIHTFTVQPGDNEAIYKCVASSVVTTLPMDASVELNVLFPPVDVKMFGPAEARSGDTVSLTCLTGPSNPPVSLTWVVDGTRVPHTGTGKEKVPGGWMTSANVSVTISRQESMTKTFHCIAVSESLGQTVAETATVAVIFPPSAPVISEYQEGTILHAGEQHTFKCATSGGNPAAALRWYKGDVLLDFPTKSEDGQVVSELTVKLDETDNEALYRCEATNAATQKPLSANITLSVYFPPSTVNIRTSPKTPKAGEAVTIICESGSSYPESVIQWWKDGSSVTGQHDVVADGAHGGKSTRSLLHMNVTDEDDKAVVTCRATNLLLQRSVHESVVLSVHYKPEFVSGQPSRVELNEGETALLNATARGNPSVISYVWIKDGLNVISDESRFEADKPWAHGLVPKGPLLEFKVVNRSHEGEYGCEASNTVGSSRIKFTVVVLYPAGIVNLTESVQVMEGSEAKFDCFAKANPMTTELFQWRSENGDEERMEVYAHMGHSALTVRNVTRADTGLFHCTVYNGMGGKNTKAARLFVKYPPSIRVSPNLQNVAVDLGETAALTCVAEGYPQMRFSWLHGAKTINGTTHVNKYTLQLLQLKNSTWESVLFVSNVEEEDLGEYVCVAQNDLGEHREEIRLKKKARPDPPTDVRVSNVTHSSCLIQWSPGFNGGLQQYFRVRYKNAGATDFVFRDVFPINVSLYIVHGLKPSTKFTFGVMARNALGDSDYSEASVTIETLKAAPGVLGEGSSPSEDTRPANIPWTTLTAVSAVGIFLLLLNVALVVCFIRKRRNRQIAKDKAAAERKETYDSAMYTPNKYHETINGEALYPVAEKASRSTEGIAEESAKNQHRKMNGNVSSGHSVHSIEMPTILQTGTLTKSKNQNFPDVVKIRRPSIKRSGSRDIHRSHSQLGQPPVSPLSDRDGVAQLNSLDRRRLRRSYEQVEDGPDPSCPSAAQTAELLLHNPPHKRLPCSESSVTMGKIGSHAV